MTEPSVWPHVLWGILGLGLVVYAVTGGADFGAGVWSLLARGPRKEKQREAVQRAIAPIWEANHVWLIFVIVVMFSAFSRAFAVICVALHVPIALALLGMVLRGAAYVFHAYGIQSDGARLGWQRAFAWASLFTPVMLGTVVGALSSGEIHVEAGVVTSGFFAGWTTPFALLVGVFSLALFALLAAVYLAADTTGALSDDFRRRALVMEGVAGALALATFIMARSQVPALHESLARSSFSWPVQLVTALLAMSTVWLVIKRRLALARYTAAGQVGCVVLGWGLAMDGHFVLPGVHIGNASAHPEVMPALAAVIALGSVVLIPALVYLFRVFKQARSPH